MLTFQDGTLIVLVANIGIDDDISMIIMLLNRDNDIPLYYYMHTTESVISIKLWGKYMSHVKIEFMVMRKTLVFNESSSEEVREDNSWTELV